MAEIKDRENALIMETTKGKVVIELFPDLAPGHVGRIKELAREGAYDGVVFHRVIDGFMAQTGDVKFGKSGGKDFNPSRAGMGGSEPECREFAVLHLLRGCRLPESPVHGVGPGHRRHGECRQDQARRTGAGS